MRILMIGGTGFIGRHVTAQLAAEGHEVAVVHRGKTDADLPERVHHFLGDRAALAERRDELAQFGPEVVIDMILSSAAHAQSDLETFRGIAQRIVAVSSADVYRAMAIVHRLEDGPPEPVPLTEESRLRAGSSTYSKEALAAVRSIFEWVDDDYNKVEVERAIRSDPALPATIVRLPMVYGPGDPLHRPYPIVKRVEDRRPVLLFEETAARWRPCRGYVENVAHAIVLAATSDNATRRVYNIADPEPIPEIEWAERGARALGWNGRTAVLPWEEMPRHLVFPFNLEQDLFIDSSRIRSELGYREPFSIEESLRRTMEWERANPPSRTDPLAYDYASEDRAIASLPSD